MKKRLLSFIAGTCLCGFTFAQVNVPLLNPSFELPLGGAKITTLDDNAVPGWFSDTTYTNTGREADGSATDGAMIGFTSNQDGTVAQVVEEIADVSNVVTYVLTFDGSLTWTPGTETEAKVYTLFTAYSGSDRTSRVVIDSMAFPLIYGWQTYNQVVEFEANSAYAGDSLVIEYNVYGDEAEADRNTWVKVDNFRLKKYNGVYTGENILALENPSFELPEGGKITTLDNDTIPGWFSDTSYVNTGREADGSATDGAMIGFTSNQDGTVAHLVGLIGDVPQAVTYVLTFDGSLTWTPGTETEAKVYTLFTAYSGSDRTSRVVVDSMAFPLIYGWQSYSHAVEFEANSVYAGDSLVIEYNVYGDEAEADRNTWVKVDNFKLAKYTEGEEILYPIANILDGTNHIDANDFSGDFSASWDADSIYMQFAVVDDSIVSAGTSYEVDNLEIYFDMDNSKNIHWPRNGGWVADDPTYDTNDYQLRLVPEVDWITNNEGFGDVVNQVYTETANGYLFNLNIAWNDLLEGFVPEVGNVIGFDINASDNDNDPFYRDQITLNSPTLMLFNDPSLWANVQFGPYGQFIGLQSDNTPPTVVTGLDTVSVDSTSINLQWVPATDQASAVMSYIIYQDDAVIDTIYGDDETLQTYNATGLTPATAYSFAVVAVDNYGNESEISAAIDVTTDEYVPSSINEQDMTVGRIYPNPSTGVVNFISNTSLPVTLEIYNIAGNLVLSEMFTNNCRIDLSANDSGLYLVYLKSADKVQVEKLIIR